MTIIPEVLIREKKGAREMRDRIIKFIRDEAQDAVNTELTLRTHPASEDSLRAASAFQLHASLLKRFAEQIRREF